MPKSKFTPKAIEVHLVRARVIKEMELDNGCTFDHSDANIAELDAAIDEMVKAGWEASQDDIELIAAGDQDEAEEKFKLVPGYPELSVALNKIFNSPASR